MNARLELRFERGKAGTVMRVGVQDPPWRVIRAFPQPGGASLVHLHNVSGGVLAGDDLTLDVEVGPGAKAQLTSTGATRLYRHRAGTQESKQRTRFTVGQGGLLEYLPDALIPFRDSRHRQQTAVTLAEGATVLWWEVIAPGRQAMGEEFAFNRLSISTKVEDQNRPLLLEDFEIAPALRADTAAGWGGFKHAASFYAFQAGRPAPDLRKLESELTEMACRESRPGCTIWGASALAAGGIVVRGLSATSRGIPATLARFWRMARLFLTAEEAIPPRKLK